VALAVGGREPSTMADKRLNGTRTPSKTPPNDMNEPVVSEYGGDSRGSISALKVKAMAVRLRHKVHLMRNNRVNAYSSLATKVHDEDTRDREKGYNNWDGLSSILLHPFSVLLIAFPLAFTSKYLEWSAKWTFWLNMAALVPLAKILGDGTEELAAALKNDTLSGLLNATLGNAVEIILSIQTLRKGLLDVVKATLLGSILSNILLVLGTSFLLGGIVGSNLPSGKNHIIHIEDYQASRCTPEKEHIFSVKNALVNMGMQLLACMTCALPTVFAAQAARGEHPDHDKVLEVSRIGACIIILSYVAYIFFQLHTHKRMLSVDEGADSDDEDAEDNAGLSAPCAITLMMVTTGLIAVCSELLVECIKDTTGGLPARFIGIILLPFAGNACEHASAVRFAMQDRPGLAIGIAVGSSTQISLFVIPLTVIIGWCLDQPMDLNFGIMNTAVLILSVLVVLTLVIDGRSNWLKGFMLCTAYVFCAVLYWYMPPPLE